MVYYILGDVDDHVVGNDTGGRADSIMVITGPELDLSVFDHGVRLFGSLGQTRVDGAVAYAAFLNGDHAVPLDRRAGVHDNVLLEAGDGLDGLLQTYPVPLGGVEYLDSLSV